MAKDALTFVIANYQVSVKQDQFIPTPTIHFTGALLHNGSPKGRIDFVPVDPFDGTGMGIIKVPDDPGQTTIVNLNFNTTIFAGFYQVLSSKKPVSITIGYDGPPIQLKNGAQFMITSATLSTGVEMLGD